MKQKTQLIGLCTFIVSLWAAVAITYGKQSLEGKTIDKVMPMTQASCSSSSSSSSGGE